jgi:hypothetical protein
MTTDPQTITISGKGIKTLPALEPTPSRIEQLNNLTRRVLARVAAEKAAPAATGLEAKPKTQPTE